MKSKKIIASVLSIGFMFAAFGQQANPNLSTKGAPSSNPNIERTRLVNENIAAQKAKPIANNKASVNNANSKTGLKAPDKGGNKTVPPVLQIKKEATAAQHNASITPAAISQKQAAPGTGNTVRPGMFDNRNMSTEKMASAPQQKRNNNSKITAKGPLTGSSSQQKTAPAVTK